MISADKLLPSEIGVATEDLSAFRQTWESTYSLVDFHENDSSDTELEKSRQSLEVLLPFRISLVASYPMIRYNTIENLSLNDIFRLTP